MGAPAPISKTARNVVRERYQTLAPGRAPKARSSRCWRRP